MLNSKAVLKKRLRIVSVCCAFLGWYFPCLIAAIRQGGQRYRNPLFVIKMFFVSSGAREAGLLFSMGLLLYGYYMTVKIWKKELYADKLGKKRTFSLDYQPFGDSHWAEPCEYSDTAKIRPLSECRGTILGCLTDGGDYSQCVDMYQPSRINKHVLAIGSSGSGKSFSLVMPFIMQAIKQRHSVIITDPKGELYADSAAYFMEHGYYVRRFDLITLQKSDGWDCLKFLRGLKGDELETNAQIFATIIVSNIEKEESVYSRGSIALLKALVLYTVLRRDLNESEKTIARVNEMLQQEGVEFFEKVFGRSCPEYLKPAQSAYLTFAQASPNLHGNIVSHLATGIQILQTSLLEKILSTDDIDLNMPGDKPCAFYCRFSATDNTFRFVSAMFFSMLFISLINHADRKPNKKLDVPVDFVMDEFPSIGRIPDWLEKISNIRSYGITAIMIVQGMSQIRGIYGDDATMIIGNCGTILDIGMNDEETAEWFQSRMGMTSIVVSSERTQPGNDYALVRNAFGRVTKSVAKDYLMSISDLYNMNVDDVIIIFQHCCPIFAHKVPITAFPDYDSKRRINDKDVPNFDETEKRTKARLQEELRVQEYNRTHPVCAVEEDPSYEEPVDFSAMSTISILSFVFREELARLMPWIDKWLQGKSLRSRVEELLRKKTVSAENSEKDHEAVPAAGLVFDGFEDMFKPQSDEKKEVEMNPEGGEEKEAPQALERNEDAEEKNDASAEVIPDSPEHTELEHEEPAPILEDQHSDEKRSSMTRKENRVNREKKRVKPPL